MGRVSRSEMQSCLLHWKQAVREQTNLILGVARLLEDGRAVRNCEVGLGKVG
jgi:hypothetical protein